MDAAISLAPGAMAAMATAAAAAWPQEACGLLIGRRTADRVAVDAFRPTGNDAVDARHGYTVAPLELLAADREALAAGREIVGIWHSHPDAPPWPSRRDTEEAFEGYSYGIHAATREGAGELRFFELANGAFGERSWRLEDEVSER
jgi:proteasome lid subunit RPN8/RPN11